MIEPVPQNFARLDADWDADARAYAEEKQACLERLERDLTRAIPDCRTSDGALWWPGGGERHLDWVILGEETGPGARPMQPEWALDVWRQCKAAGVPFFWKQWGRNVVWGAPDDDELQEQLTMVQTREFPGREEGHR